MTEEFPLHEAIKENKTLLAKQLIDENPKWVLKKDADERTPLHWACSKNNYELVEYMTRSGNIDLDDVVDLSGWSPLHITASIGNVEIFLRLVDTCDADVNHTTDQGTTPLHLAVSKNHPGLVRKLVEEYGCSCRIKDKKGGTALHRAASIGSQPMVRLLLDKGKVNVNTKDNDGWTALHHALAEGWGDVAIELVKGGADVDALNSDGEKPVQVSVDERVGRYFLEHTK